MIKLSECKKYIEFHSADAQNKQRDYWYPCPSINFIYRIPIPAELQPQSAGEWKKACDVSDEGDWFIYAINGEIQYQLACQYSNVWYAVTGPLPKQPTHIFYKKSPIPAPPKVGDEKKEDDRFELLSRFITFCEAESKVPGAAKAVIGKFLAGEKGEKLPPKIEDELYTRIHTAWKEYVKNCSNYESLDYNQFKAGFLAGEKAEK